MIRYLIRRPISVLMSFLALVILGIITYFTLPTSLLPDIAIPEITVQVTGKNLSAREVENTVVKPLRSQLMQVAHLQSIQSESRDEVGQVRLRFKYGTKTDLAFIEVNEKVDAVMNAFPRGIERPRVVKASATDIPVFNLNLTLSGDSAFSNTDEAAFLKLCELSENIIKRRLEQLPEVTMVDMTGTRKKQLVIVPDEAKMEILGLRQADLEAALSASNMEPGSAVVHEGHYEYNIKFSSVLRTADDVRNTYLKVNDRLLQLKDIARVDPLPEEERGASYFNGRRAVTMGVIKQADVKMEDLKEATSLAIKDLKEQYPGITFSQTGDQSDFLSITIGNLKQDLAVGFILICLITIFFLRDVRMPLIIALSLAVSLIISMLAFFLFHLSLNIISISGLILSVGMMIDSAIIVTDNITQYRTTGMSLEDACVRGTNEVITPMLTSTLTTVAVFFPLIFMSDIAGAIFYDQAMSVTLSLFVSYFTGIMLLPVLYKLTFSRHRRKKVQKPEKKESSPYDRLTGWYNRGIDFTFAHKRLALASAVLSLPLCFLLFGIIKKEKMPEVDRNELTVKVDWNENIHVEENRKRADELIRAVNSEIMESSLLAGTQQFLTDRDRTMNASQARIDFKVSDPNELEQLEKDISSFFKKHYPQAVFSLSAPETVFEKLFSSAEPDLVLELYPQGGEREVSVDSLNCFRDKLQQATGEAISGPAFTRQLHITPDREKLMLYRISPDEITRKLKSAFSENEILTLRSSSSYVPLLIKGDQKTVEEVIAETFVTGADNAQYPLSDFITLTYSEGLKDIVAGNNGEYIPFSIARLQKESHADKTFPEILLKSTQWDFILSGGLFQNRDMINQLTLILLVSVLMMYFILTAQFESFLQPLILFVEIPIDIAAALLLLMLCGHTLNLMSAIGIVVTCGIIINDSILKIDMVNELRKAGLPLLEAIHEAGRRRLRSIVMTALTSILALLPFLFSHDLGSELQKPLSIAMIGAMVVGTVVSLFLIPLIYWMIYRKDDLKKTNLNG